MVVVTTGVAGCSGCSGSERYVVEIGGGGLGERALDFEAAIGRQVRLGATAASRGSGDGASFMAAGSLA